MASIDKRIGKDGRVQFSVRWRSLSDGTHLRRPAPSKAAAKALKLEIETCHALGREWEPAVGAGAPTLPEMLIAYLKESKRTRASTTYANRAYQLESFRRWLSARENGRELHPHHLSRKTLTEYDTHMATVGNRPAREKRVGKRIVVVPAKPCATSTRRHALGIIMGFWKWAYDVEEWERWVPRPRKIDLPPDTPKTVYAGTWEQMDRTIGELGSERMRRVGVLERFLAWRVSQIVRLDWSDFDFARDLIIFRGSLGKTPNERKGRVIPFPKALKAEMETWCEPDKRVGRVAGEGNSDSVRRALRKAWAKSAAPTAIAAGRPNHAFRKGWRTELRAKGCDSDALEYWCGRRTGGQKDTYTDPRCLPLMQIADALPPLAPCARRVPTLKLLVFRARA